MLPMSGQQNAQKEQKERVRILRKAGITEADAEKIGKAIEKAEQTTSGEIAAAIIPQSHSYDFWELFFALSCSAVLFAVFVFLSDKIAHTVSFFFWGELPVRVMPLLTGALVFLSCALIFFFANISALDRLIVPSFYRNEAVFRRAMRLFTESGIYDTKEHTGILIFISLLERRVCIIADRGICSKIEQPVWDTLAAALSEGFGKKNVRPAGSECSASAEALIQTVNECGALLAKHFPAHNENPDELSNELIVLRGGE